MGSRRVQITIEFEEPQALNLMTCAEFVLQQCKRNRINECERGPGYMEYDETMRVVEAKIVFDR